MREQYWAGFTPRPRPVGLAQWPTWPGALARPFAQSVVTTCARPGRCVCTLAASAAVAG
jgi:hypothetical protein